MEPSQVREWVDALGSLAIVLTNLAVAIAALNRIRILGRRHDEEESILSELRSIASLATNGSVTEKKSEDARSLPRSSRSPQSSK